MMVRFWEESLVDSNNESSRLSNPYGFPMDFPSKKSRGTPYPRQQKQKFTIDLMAEIFQFGRVSFVGLILCFSVW